MWSICGRANQNFKNTKAALIILRCSMFVSSIKIFTNLTYIQNCLYTLQQQLQILCYPWQPNTNKKNQVTAHTRKVTYSILTFSTKNIFNRDLQILFTCLPLYRMCV